MFRCLLDSSLLQTGEVELPPDEAKHLVQVLRARKGDALELLDGCGKTAKAKLIVAEKRKALVRIDEVSTAPQRSPLITLIQGLPKNPAMEAIVQKSTELGVHRIQPLNGAYSVMQVKATDAAKKCQRWSDISKAAMKQSGMPWAPQIGTPKALRELLPSAKNDKVLHLMADLSPATENLRDVLRRIDPPPCEIVCWVGPEGGFDPQEIALLKSAGVHSVSLGENILRADTAALYLLSVIAYEYGN